MPSPNPLNPPMVPVAAPAEGRPDAHEPPMRLDAQTRQAAIDEAIGRMRRQDRHLAHSLATLICA